MAVKRGSRIQSSFLSSLLSVSGSMSTLAGVDAVLAFSSSALPTRGFSSIFSAMLLITVGDEKDRERARGWKRFVHKGPQVVQMSIGCPTRRRCDKTCIWKTLLK